MRYGYWLPIFGGWLRNVEDEGMEASWDYVRRLACRSEEIGYDLTLIAELNLNDIKGIEAPALDAWSTAAALAAVTERLELMVAVRPTFHAPALLAKQAANIDHICGTPGRLSLNVVSSWWADEARQYGVHFEQHEDRYARTAEWLDVVDGTLEAGPLFLRGPALPGGKRGRSSRSRISQTAPRPSTPAARANRPRTSSPQRCDAYVMHGDPPARIREKIADMRERRERLGLPPMQFGDGRRTPSCVTRSARRGPNWPGSRTCKSSGRRVCQLPAVARRARSSNSSMTIEEYSVSNRGLRPGLVGTAAHGVRERVAEFEDAGVDLLLLQCSPQAEEMERFAAQVIRADGKTNSTAAFLSGTEIAAR